MHLLKYWSFILVVILSCSSQIPAQLLSNPATLVNLVSNPGFETGETPWQLDNWMKNEVMAQRDSNHPHGGNWSMKVQLVKVINLPVVMFAFPNLPVRPKSAVRIRFWARGISNGANLTVMVRHEIEPRITYLRTEMYLTDEWQEYMYIIQLPGDINTAATSLRFALNQAGVFWIDDISVEELAAVDNGPQPQFNTIRNPSFEVGTEGWTATFRKREFGTLSQESGNGIPAPDDARLDTQADSTAPDGQRFLQFKIGKDCRVMLTSAYFPARYGHKGHLCFYLRSNGLHKFDVGIGGGINSGSSLQTQARVSSIAWQKFILPVTLQPSQDGVYFAGFRFNEPGVYFIDAVSFAEDDQTNVLLYPPCASIKALENAPTANLYTSKANINFKLLIAGEHPGHLKKYKITVCDYLEREIASVTVPVVFSTQGYGETVFQVPAKEFGAFRIEAREMDSAKLLAEQIYSVLPPLPPPGDRPGSYFGGHLDLTPYNLEIARKAGFRWLRMWPPLLTTWIAAEPQPGTWNFPTDALQYAHDQGFQVAAILGTAPDFKADINRQSSVNNRWSHAYPPGKISEWKEYVARCTSSFYPYIKTWELWNEPDGGYLQVKPELKKEIVYTDLLKATREVFDSLGKPITLLGPAVANINAPLGWNVLQLGGGRWMDAFSFHFYSLSGGGNNPDDTYLLNVLKKLRTYKNRFGEPMPLWHTEGGMYLQGGQSWLSTYRIPVSSPVKKPNAAASMVRAALFFKAMGVKHYFDFELSATAAGRQVNEDMTTGFIEVTGIPGPAIAAHAAMVALTEDAEAAGFENYEFHLARVKVAHFKRDTGMVNVYWSDLPVPIKEIISLQPQDKVLDMMGNQVSPENAQTGEFPLYIIKATK